MNHMSFSATTEQIRNKTKTVTRRIGWWNLNPGDVLLAIEKGQGLKKGEKVKPICYIRVKDCRAELLRAITKDDCIKEGFPEMSPGEFARMFIKMNKCDINEIVNRIEFEYMTETKGEK